MNARHYFHSRLACWPLLGVLLSALIAPAGFALNPAEKPANYTITRWDAEDGLPHNSIRQLYQTRDGYIWIGTLQGLARFDGLTFTIFSSPGTPGFPGNQITALAETPDGSLWIGTIAGLVRYQDGRFTAYGRAEGLKSEIVNGLCVAPDGSLWIGGRDGITRWVDGKLVTDIDTSGYNTTGMRHIARDSHDALWLSTGTEALRYAGGKFTRFGRAEGLPDRPLQMIREDADGRLLAVTQEGLFRLEGDRFVPFAQNAALSSPRVATALLDRAGNLWIGSLGGLDRYSDGKLVPYVDAHGGKFTGVDALLEDREGCLWVGGGTGLTRFTDRRGSMLGKEEGVFGAHGLAVHQSRDGSIWASSWTGGVARFQNGTVRQYTLGAPLSQESVTVIYEAPDGAMWFGNRGSALDRLEGDKVTTFVYPPGVATARPASAIHIDPDGEMLAGIAQRGLLHLRDGRLVPVPEAAELATQTVRTIHRTRDGRLLLGTTKGLYQRAPDRSWRVVTPPGLSRSPEIYAFLEEADGVIWLATAGLGLVRWTPGLARAYGTREGMVDDTLYSVVDDGLGSFWVSSARGLARVRKAELAELDRGVIAHLNVLTLGRVDGLTSGASPGSGSPAAVLLTDGRLLTATNRGFAVVEPRSFQVNTQPPTVAIESAIADDQPLDLGSRRAITVPAGTNRLEIRYTALSLVAPHRLRFRYRLEGSDPGWIEAGRERSASYTHLAPGSYLFHVLACNNDGVWTETGATLAVTLLPLYYQTLWFRLAALALLGGALTAAVGLRLRQLKRREHALTRANTELDRRVQERTGELTRSNEELQHRETLFRLIFEHAPVGISWNRVDLGTQYHFNSSFRRILDLPAGKLPDNSLLAALVHPDDAPRQSVQEALLHSGRTDSYALEQRFTLKDGRQVWGAFAAAVVRDAQGRIIQVIGILEDITARKETETALEQAHRDLLVASRQAGMAEVATGVLHNVGNVLNSVNVSATLVTDHIRHSKAVNLAKVCLLFDQHQADLAAFLTTDPKGLIIPGYLGTLAGSLAEERVTIIGEMDNLRKNIEHIKDIVAMQQNYAKNSGFTETISLPDLVEDALRMNAGSLARHGVDLARDYQVRPVVTLDKHKVMQILINLVRNAKYACDESGRADKLITIRLTAGDHCLRIAVCDNGVGIPPENLTRIFNHGFTTRKTGHGFGLHSGALAAKELGGALVVESAGPGQGATFTLELPYNQPENPAHV